MSKDTTSNPGLRTRDSGGLPLEAKGFQKKFTIVGRGESVTKPEGNYLANPHLGPWPMLSMHELSLSISEPMLSLSMLILTTYPEAALDVIMRKQNQI